MKYMFRVFFGAFGTSQLAEGNYREAVMRSIAFITYWASGPLRRLIGKDDMIFVFLSLIWYGPIFGEETVSVVSFWIAGTYGVEMINVHPLIEFFVSVSFASIALRIVRFKLFTGVPLLTILVMYQLWDRPRFFDIHFGNCFGAQGVALMWIVSRALAGIMFVGISSFNFNAMIPIQAYIVCRLMPKQTRDPFNRETAMNIQSVMWFAYLYFLHVGILKK